jgi:hypothetical protein
MMHLYGGYKVTSSARAQKPDEIVATKIVARFIAGQLIAGYCGQRFADIGRPRGVYRITWFSTGGSRRRGLAVVVGAGRFSPFLFGRRRRGQRCLA